MVSKIHPSTSIVTERYVSAAFIVLPEKKSTLEELVIHYKEEEYAHTHD